jgi:hypothetical protein
MRKKEMGYRNTTAAEQNVFSRGVLCRGSKMTFDAMAASVLTYMCLHSYDYPMSDDLKRKNAPCRLYEGGLKMIMSDLGMIVVPPDKLLDSDGTVDLVAHRARSVLVRISLAIKFLTKIGVIKVMRRSYLGRNAAYLLLIGDEHENEIVENYDRRVLENRRGLTQYKYATGVDDA